MYSGNFHIFEHNKATAIVRLELEQKIHTCTVELNSVCLQVPI